MYEAEERFAEIEKIGGGSSERIGFDLDCSVREDVSLQVTIINFGLGLLSCLNRS